MRWRRAQSESAGIDQRRQETAPHWSGRLTETEVVDAARTLNDADRRIRGQMASDPTHLTHFEGSVYSQNGEDGLIAEIFNRIGCGQSTFVEIGAADGAENCTASLVDAGWSGVWFEGDSNKADAARRWVADRPVQVVAAFVDCESIGSLLAETDTPALVDLLVIDIDGNDAWIWEELERTVQARVVAIEYNASVGPDDRWVMPYSAAHQWDETSRYGASLQVMAELGASFGYQLVACDSKGVNAFFVRRSEAAAFTQRSVSETWLPPRFHLPYGHPAIPIVVPDTEALTAEQARSIQLKTMASIPGSAIAGSTLHVGVVVVNGCGQRIGEGKTSPIRVTSQWVGSLDERIPAEPHRSIQPWWADPGETAALVVRTVVPDEPGTHRLELRLVQEGVRWLDGDACVTDAGLVVVA